MRKRRVMDGLETQSQHERGVVAPFRKREKGNLRSQQVGSSCNSSGAASGINNTRGRARALEALQEFGSRLGAALLPSPPSLLPQIPPAPRYVSLLYRGKQPDQGDKWQ